MRAPLHIRIQRILPPLISMAVVWATQTYAMQQTVIPDRFPDPHFEQLTVEDGLPESTIICMLQDHLGYMWFGTLNGLVRYDGYNMKAYQPEPEDSLSLSSRAVVKIYEDKLNTLWIGTSDGGLNSFDRATETFTKYTHNPDDSTSINSNLVYTMCEDKNGDILVGTDAGLNVLDKQTKKFRQIYQPDSISSYEVKAIIKDRLTGKIYVGGSNKIFILGSDEKILSESTNIAGVTSDLGVITSFYQALDGTIWISHSKGLARFHSLLNTIKVYHPRSFINDIAKEQPLVQDGHYGEMIEDKDGFIWIVGTWSYHYIGLAFFDPKQEQFKRYEPGSEYEGDISYTALHSLLKDRSGIIWAGTWNFGLKKWDAKKNKFKRLKPDPANSKEKHFGIGPVAEDSKGIIWCTSSNGLYSYDRFSETFRRYKYDPTNDANWVSHVWIDSSGIIWVGTPTGLRKFDRDRGTFQLYSFTTDPLAPIGSNMVSFILEEEKESLWVGTYGGLIRFEKATGTYHRYTHDPEHPQSISANDIWVIYRDRMQTLWVGIQRGGLNKFNPSKKSFKSYQFTKGAQVTFVTRIYEDKKGNFWIGTFNSGLHLFDRDKETSVHNISATDGLTNNHVQAILEDDAGHLWIATRYGMSRYDPQTRWIRNYFTYESFERNSYWNTACKLSTGEMAFGTWDGFIIFHPDSIKDDPVPPEVVITDVSLFNRPEEQIALDGFISELDELNLAYDQNDLRFDYVGLHFGEPEKNQYKYMLENFDEDWVHAATQRNATYTNLDAGEYVFRVTASNRDGVWNTEGASLKIIIPPPFWATWWAYSLYIIAFGSVLYGIRRYEMNRQALKHRAELEHVQVDKLKEIDQVKSRFFANISHEFRTPLTLIEGPAKQIAAGDTNVDPKTLAGHIVGNSRRLLRLVNQLLDLSRIESGTMKLRTKRGDIVAFVKGIASSFESSGGMRGITLALESEEEQIELYFDQAVMEGILLNLVSNAFKCTLEGGEVRVAVARSGDAVVISVSDTGIGISKEELPRIFDRFYQVDGSYTREHEGTGIGLALTKELVEVHHGSITVESQPGRGTSFSVSIPLGTEHLHPDEIVDAPAADDDVALSHPVAEETVHETIDGPAEEQTDQPIVLVTEDNAEVRAYIKGYLVPSYRVLDARDGMEGLQMAREIIPDLIISDVMMPKMDGNELCKTLKMDEKTSHIPIILLTAKAEMGSKIEGLETGADAYLIKPFEVRELLVRIKNLIDIRKKLREKFSVGTVLKPGEIAVTSIDDQFLQKAMAVVEEQMANEDFSVDVFAREVGMSRSQLHRKLTSLTNQSPSAFIRYMRLHRAMDILKKNAETVSETCYSVGFNEVSYFTKCFHKQFGVLPSEVKNLVE